MSFAIGPDMLTRTMRNYANAFITTGDQVHDAQEVQLYGSDETKSGLWLAVGILDLRPRILPPIHADLLLWRGPVPDGADSW